jgi:non-specific serine/threonine protein kinase/serine/threonine-protein kinase
MGPDDRTATDLNARRPRLDMSGAVVGRCRLLGLIGEGAFGEVYEAEQTEPVRRRVAVKIIKPGMDSASVVARFEAERQALAVMDHPCIAKVFDGGVTAPEQGGRPYFVMELVRGVPITEHCDTQQLTIDERCELFTRVCEAVQHAHTKGVVHRDLKPSNVLVAYDAEGRATPKVIDFGVAKALNQRLSARTLFTERGQLIGTPEYMSPEQAEMSGQDIDTRSDVYSLGVMLYELLTGVLPFDSRTLREAAFNEIQRIIRETDPPKPSTKLSTLLSAGDSAERVRIIVKARRADARAITGVLRRDLDWVVMRCLEKERDRRYASASGLAEELRRYLRGEAVEAGPPSAAYRVSKFVRRHRAGVSLAAAGVCALVVGLTVLAVLLRSVRAERDRGERLIAFLQGEALTPPLMEDMGRNATLWDVLASASEQAREDFAEDPGTLARVLAALGESRLRLGDEAGALPVLSEAERLGVEASVPEGAEWGQRLRVWHAEALGRVERYDEALSAIDAAAAVADGAVRAEAATVRAAILKWAGRLDEAERAYAEVVALWTSLRGPRGEETLEARYDAALVMLERGKAARSAGDDAAAQGLYRAALDAMRPVLDEHRAALGDDHHGTLQTMLEVATLHSRLGEYDQAIGQFEGAIGGLSRRLGETHWRTLQARASLGSMRYRQGDYAGAVAIYRPVLAAYRASGRMASTDAFVVAKACGRADAKLGEPLAGIDDLVAIYDAASAVGTGADPAAVAQEIAERYRAVGDEVTAAQWDAAALRDTKKPGGG